MEKFNNMVEVENYIYNVIVYRHVSSKGIDETGFKKEALKFLFESDRIPENLRASKMFNFYAVKLSPNTSKYFSL